MRIFNVFRSQTGAISAFLTTLRLEMMMIEICMVTITLQLCVIIKMKTKSLVFCLFVFVHLCERGWCGRSEWVMAARKCRSRVLSRVWSIWRQINSPINNLELYQYLSWGKRYQKMITSSIQPSPCIPPRPKIKICQTSFSLERWGWKTPRWKYYHPMSKLLRRLWRVWGS